MGQLYTLRMHNTFLYIALILFLIIVVSYESRFTAFVAAIVLAVIYAFDSSHMGDNASKDYNGRYEGEEYEYGYGYEKIDGGGEARTGAQLTIINSIARDLLAITSDKEDIDKINKINTMSDTEIKNFVNKVIEKLIPCDGICQRKITRIVENVGRL
jgi:hypothetical protein